MLRKILLGVSLLALTAACAWADGAWLHIRVLEKGPDGETVRVNVPLKLVRELMPLIEADDFHRGKVRLDSPELTDVDIRAVLGAVREAEDGEYVTVEGHDENVRVWKSHGELLIKVDDADEKVDIRVRLEVAEAIFTDQVDEIDLLALVDALERHGGGDLVTVVGDDEEIRIWLDDQNDSD
jgi:hypothetical protein